MDHVHDDNGHNHSHGHDHKHDHKPDHAHSHSEGHGHSEGEYYLEQLLTILICGSIGLVAVLMYSFNRLNYLLVVEFHLWVLGGGIVLLLLTAIRGIALWGSVSPAKTVVETRVHGPNCDHEHGHDHEQNDHAHAAHGVHAHHDHDHMPGMIYLKVIPFALPILMFIMGLPNTSFSKDWIERRLGKDEVLNANVVEVADKGGDVLQFDFNELNVSAYDPDKRAQYEGRRVRVKGQIKAQAGVEKQYTLFKLKMTCCAADMIPLKALIKSDTVIPASQLKDYDWVTAEGVLQFVEAQDKKQFLPVIRVTADKLKKAAPE